MRVRARARVCVQGPRARAPTARPDEAPAVVGRSVSTRSPPPHVSARVGWARRQPSPIGCWARRQPSLIGCCRGARGGGVAAADARPPRVSPVFSRHVVCSECPVRGRATAPPGHPGPRGSAWVFRLHSGGRLGGGRGRRGRGLRPGGPRPAGRVLSRGVVGAPEGPASPARRGRVARPAR